MDYCVYLDMKNEIKKKGNEMTYEEYLELLNEEDTDENAGNFVNMSDSDTEAMEEALSDMREEEYGIVEMGESTFGSKTVADYMNHGV